MRRKIVIWLLCIGAVLVALSVGVHISARGEVKTPYLGRDEKKIREHLASCAEDVNSLKASGALVEFRGYIHGQKQWDAFMKKVKKKEKCSIDIVTFSMGSSVVMSYIEYDGTDFYQLIDYTRLPENSAGLRGYQNYIYTDLNFIDIPKKEYESLYESRDISVMEESVKMAVFSNEELHTFDDYINYCFRDRKGHTFEFILWPQKKG